MRWFILKWHFHTHIRKHHGVHHMYEKRRFNTKTGRKNAFKRVRVFEIYDMQIYNTFQRWVCVNNLKEYIILRNIYVSKTHICIEIEIDRVRDKEHRFVKCFKTTRKLYIFKIQYKYYSNMEGTNNNKRYNNLKHSYNLGCAYIEKCIIFSLLPIWLYNVVYYKVFICY